MFGGPGSGAAAGIAALLAVAAIYVVLVYLMIERDDRWIFYAVVIMAPLGLLPILLAVPLSVRYFMVSAAACLVLLSSGYAALLRRGVAGRVIGLTLLAIFVAGNAVNTGNLLRFGRGQYLAALRFMEKNSDGREVVITSDHDFRNWMLVNYYKRYLARPESIRYANGATLNERGADWLILHRFELTGRPDRVTDGYRNAYQLVKTYRYSDLSGWNWLLYHNLNRPPVATHSPLLQ
jgi:hypothetical protein